MRQGALALTSGLLLFAVGTFPVRSEDAKPVAPSSAIAATNASAVVKRNSPENSVVKIFATMRYPDFYRPWTKEAPREVTGSGVVIGGKRILSNAHLALYASQIQVQANQAGDKLPATVEYVAPGMDLAVLKLEDESFFDTHPPIERASVLPEIKDSVMAYGFPKGGSSLSITKGIVSRIEFTSYNFHVMGLRIQIDAAINPGNSGGPVLAGDKMIGLAFSRLGDAENIGYIIPNEEIDLFLKDIADGHYDGKPTLYDNYQTLENPALRSFLKLNKSVEGIVIQDPANCTTNYPLKEWDVITKIGDVPVDNQGMVHLGTNLRVRFTYMVQKIAKDGMVPLTIVRGGKEMPVQVPVPPKFPLVINAISGKYPSYFIFGPLVFSTVSSEMVENLCRNDSDGWSSALIYRGSPMAKRVLDKPSFPGEEMVFVSSPFFPHKLSKGYSNPALSVVKSINKQPVKNLKHLVELLRDSKDEFIVVEFCGYFSETIVFPRAQMVAATEDILTDNGVRSQGTADTMAVWNAKASK